MCVCVCVCVCLMFFMLLTNKIQKKHPDTSFKVYKKKKNVDINVQFDIYNSITKSEPLP